MAVGQLAGHRRDREPDTDQRTDKRQRPGGDNGDCGFDRRHRLRARDQHDQASPNNLLFATATLNVQSPPQDLWTTRASKPTALTASDAAVINGILYVVGGFNSSGLPSNVVEAYNPATDTWTTVAPMPTARGYLG